MDPHRLFTAIQILENTGKFVIAGKLLIIFCWFYFLNRQAKTGKASLGLAGVLLIGFICVVFEMLPLKVGYSLPCIGCDRSVYVAQAASYAIGNPFGEDFAYQGIPSIYSPVYPYLVAMVHWVTGFDVIRIYDYGAALTLVILGLVLFYFGCPTDAASPPDHEEKRWVGLLMAFLFLYMSTTPVRWQDHYESFWNTLILLKPGHIMSFFFLPILYFFMAGRFRWLYLISGGLALGVMVPTFIITAIFVICGLALYPVLIYFFYRSDFKQEILKVISVCFIGLLSSIWWWWPIFVTYGVSMGGEGVPAVHRTGIKVVFDPFEATFFMQPLFWLGIIGIVIMLNRRRKGDLLILGLITAMYLGKLIYPFSWVILGFAPQAWECSMFYLRPAMAMSAAVGLYALASYASKNHNRIKQFLTSQPTFAYLRQTWVKRIIPSHFFTWDKKASVIACFLLVLTPYASPIWHVTNFNPWWGDRGHPLPEKVTDFVGWIKDNTPYNAVFLADGDTSMLIATYSGRKLMKDKDGRNALVNFVQRKSDAGIIYESEDLSEVFRKLKKYNVSYIVFTNKVIEEYPRAKINKFGQKIIEKVYESDMAKIFRVKLENI